MPLCYTIAMLVFFIGIYLLSVLTQNFREKGYGKIKKRVVDTGDITTLAQIKRQLI
jgi:hypothetical protein